MDTPYSMVRLPEVASTQDEARSRFSGTPVLVVADRQSGGRGRAGVGWLNADRALAASVAWRRETALTVVPLMAGLSIARLTGLGLKWPNDVVSTSGKVGGILSETADEVTVVGLGMNLFWESPPAGAASLHRFDPGPDAASALAADWARQLLQMVSAPRWPREEYLDRCTTIGQPIKWVPDGSGLAVDIDESGGLVVESLSGRRTLVSGEVRHVRLDDGAESG